MKKNTITLLAALALAGAAVVAPSVSFTGQTVYANTQTYINNSTETIGVIVYYQGEELDGSITRLVDPAPLIEVGPGEEIAAPREFEGYTLVESQYTPPMLSEGILTYYYKKNTSTPPTQQPIEILVTHLVPPGSRGSDALILEQTTVSLNPGGQLFLEPKQFPGYAAVTADPVTLNYDEAAAGKTSVTFSYKLTDSSGGTQTPPADNPPADKPGDGNGSGTQTPPTDTPPANNPGGGNGSGTQTPPADKPVAPTTKTEAKTPANTAGGVDILGWLAMPLAALFSFKKKEE